MAFDEAYNEPENVEVLVKSLDPGQPAQLHYAHAGDAGADLRTTEEVTLKPFQRALVPTGVAIALPAGYVALVHPRSGLAVKQGVTVLNAPGTIDAGYRGEIKIHRGADPARIRPRGTWLRINRRCVLTGLQYTKTEDVSGRATRGRIHPSYGDARVL